VFEIGVLKLTSINEKYFKWTKVEMPISRTKFTVFRVQPIYKFHNNWKSHLLVDKNAEMNESCLFDSLKSLVIHLGWCCWQHLRSNAKIKWNELKWIEMKWYRVLRSMQNVTASRSIKLKCNHNAGRSMSKKNWQ